MTFRSILVANRGEIACRVIRTIRAMGMEALAVYSEADRDAPHVLLADRSLCIGGAPARESYLDIQRILEAARILGCDAIHPGYGFLSENAAFATACTESGITFIGPPASAIRLMGDKAEARRVAEEVGVDPVPGYEGKDDLPTLTREADRIGFPLLVKATKGGGGKGMRLVRTKDALRAAVEGARREAEGAFGDGTLLLERYVHPARHVEVQVLADTHGLVLPLLERECSLQRRHQKVIEESPSPAVTPKIRAALGDAAVALAQAVGYVGAGTVEFLMEESGRFWFLEMNTRLQVEHGVTEMVTAQDLVAWQITIAHGAPLDPALAHLEPCGHAIEARIYAEDPTRGFLPQAGRILHMDLPGGPGVRVDSGVRAGQDVTPHYDPMLMKVMAHGRDRDEARRRLLLALEDLTVIGPRTNGAYLIDLLESPWFEEGATFTHTLDALPVPPATPPPPAVLALLAFGLDAQGAGSTAAAHGPGRSDRYSPFDRLGPLRLVHPHHLP